MAYSSLFLEARSTSGLRLLYSDMARVLWYSKSRYSHFYTQMYYHKTAKIRSLVATSGEFFSNESLIRQHSGNFENALATRNRSLACTGARSRAARRVLWIDGDVTAEPGLLLDPWPGATRRQSAPLSSGRPPEPVAGEFAPRAPSQWPRGNFCTPAPPRRWPWGNLCRVASRSGGSSSDPLQCAD
jgi:hypothetical protein